jgi:hypothetical protein
MRVTLRHKCLALLAMALLVVPFTAHAASSVTFRVNAGPVQTVTCVGGPPCVAVFTFGAGQVSVNIGSDIPPTISLTTNNTTTGAQMLTISYSNTNQTMVGSNFHQSFSGTLNGPDNASNKVYYNASNVLQATDTLIGSGLAIGSGFPFLSSAANTSGSFVFGPAPYSITDVYTLNILNNVLETSQLTGSFAVSEPASLSLFGFGFLALGAGLRKKLLSV